MKVIPHIAAPACYLIRFDDLCPTMNWAVWDQIEDVLIHQGVKPIVSVIPDNRDSSLHFAPANPRFWERVRKWKELGWAIGLHGYQHRYISTSSGIVGIKCASEFAGVPEPQQRIQLRNAFRILDDQGVRPDIWVAPGHSFDRVTIDLLLESGLKTISDGFLLGPRIDELGALWVPQQLWRFRAMPLGLWTICCHHNSWTDSSVRGLSRGIGAVGPKIIGLNDGLSLAHSSARSSAVDRLMPPVWRCLLRLRARQSNSVS